MQLNCFQPPLYDSLHVWCCCHFPFIKRCVLGSLFSLFSSDIQLKSLTEVVFIHYIYHLYISVEIQYYGIGEVKLLSTTIIYSPWLRKPTNYFISSIEKGSIFSVGSDDVRVIIFDMFPDHVLSLLSSLRRLIFLLYSSHARVCVWQRPSNKFCTIWSFFINILKP
jgi:hypothetical protein